MITNTGTVSFLRGIDFGEKKSLSTTTIVEKCKALREKIDQHFFLGLFLVKGLVIIEAQNARATKLREVAASIGSCFACHGHQVFYVHTNTARRTFHIPIVSGKKNYKKRKELVKLWCTGISKLNENEQENLTYDDSDAFLMAMYGRTIY